MYVHSETACNDPKANINYHRFWSQTVLKHKVTLVGWPFEKLANPSDLKREDMLKLHQLLLASPPKVKFISLTSDELRDLKQQK